MTNEQKEAKIKALKIEADDIKNHRKPLGEDEAIITINVTAIQDIQDKGIKLHVSNDRQKMIIIEEPTMNISTSNNKEQEEEEQEEQK